MVCELHLNKATIYIYMYTYICIHIYNLRGRKHSKENIQRSKCQLMPKCQASIAASNIRRNSFNCLVRVQIILRSTQEARKYRQSQTTLSRNLIGKKEKWVNTGEDMKKKNGFDFEIWFCLHLGRRQTHIQFRAYKEGPKEQDTGERKIHRLQFLRNQAV